MRPFRSNPFRTQRPVPRFDVAQFLQGLQCFPLEARARLEAAVADGSISFPNGTCARTDYAAVAQMGWKGNACDPLIEDLSSLSERYGPLLELPSETLRRTGFPYAFVLDLLGKLAQGQHPAFVTGACCYITAEFDNACWPESDSDPVDLAFAMAPANSPR